MDYVWYTYIQEEVKKLVIVIEEDGVVEEDDYITIVENRVAWEWRCRRRRWWSSSSSMKISVFSYHGLCVIYIYTRRSKEISNRDRRRGSSSRRRRRKSGSKRERGSVVHMIWIMCDIHIYKKK